MVLVVVLLLCMLPWFSWGGSCCSRVPMQVAVLLVGRRQRVSRDRVIIFTKMVVIDFFCVSKIESKDTLFWILQLSEDPIWDISDLRKSLLRQS